MKAENKDTFCSVLFCSVAKSCLTLCNPTDCSMPGSPVRQCFSEFAQIHVHWVNDATQPSNPLLSPLIFLPSFPASGSFPMSGLLASGDQRSGASTSASVLPMNIQGWFPLGLTGLISLQFKRLSRGFSSTTIQKHQFFSAEPSLWYNFHIHTCLLEKP